MLLLSILFNMLWCVIYGPPCIFAYNLQREIWKKTTHVKSCCFLDSDATSCSRGGKIFVHSRALTILVTIFFYCRFGFGGAKFVFGGRHPPFSPVVAALFLNSFAKGDCLLHGDDIDTIGRLAYQLFFR